MTSPAETNGEHVPAWKKLGLKLNRAPDSPDNTASIQSVPLNGRKRNSDAGAVSEATARPSKRLKGATLKSSTPQGNDRNELPEGPTQSPSPSSFPLDLTATSDRLGTKRKSVSFTPETKTEDGDGVKKLYNNWLNSQLAADPSFNIASANPAIRPATPPSLFNPSVSSSQPLKIAKKPKAPRESKRPKPDSAAPVPAKSPLITYLDDYHNKPSEWKFSKKRQSSLLKNLFSPPTLIPSSYDRILVSYLQGLRGQSAISLIRNMALKVRDEDQEWLSTLKGDEAGQAKREQDYQAAVQRMKESLRKGIEILEEGERDKELEERWAKRRRAEVVLWGIKHEDKPTNTGSESTSQLVNGTITADARGIHRGGNRGKRKRRTTGVPDDDSSSSDSESSSEREPKKRNATDKHVPITTSTRTNGTSHEPIKPNAQPKSKSKSKSSSGSSSASTTDNSSSSPSPSPSNTNSNSNSDLETETSSSNSSSSSGSGSDSGSE